MKFQLLPVLSVMTDLYQIPLGPARFDEYLRILQSNKKGEMNLPVSGFNPMAKPPAVEKLKSLANIGIEQIMLDVLQEINNKNIEKDNHARVFEVAFNLSDDLHGGWTNRFTSDYESKFKMRNLFTRKYCVPVFWTSERIGEKEIRQRTLEYCHRTIIWKDHPNPATLAEHILQEKRIAAKLGLKASNDIDHDALQKFYTEHQDNADYSVVFNFLYGDTASVSLGNKGMGIEPLFAGYKFARWLANR